MENKETEMKMIDILNTVDDGRTHRVPSDWIEDKTPLAAGYKIFNADWTGAASEVSLNLIGKSQMTW